MVITNSNEERVTKIDTYLNAAEVFAYRSTCLKRKYGAVIVRDDAVISTGYNGAPRGKKNCMVHLGERRIAVILGIAQEKKKIIIKVKDMIFAELFMQRQMRY